MLGGKRGSGRRYGGGVGQQGWCHMRKGPRAKECGGLWKPKKEGGEGMGSPLELPEENPDLPTP